uniref:Uncharacterized protein n=1 Tax=Micrurus paraensis TaxID=1970185 RepID=A0A2D4K1G7_9SAUR
MTVHKMVVVVVVGSNRGFISLKKKNKSLVWFRKGCIKTSSQNQRGREVSQFSREVILQFEKLLCSVIILFPFHLFVLILHGIAEKESIRGDQVYGFNFFLS